MNDIITLGKKLSEMFFENFTEYDLEKNRERLKGLKNQINTLEEKLQNDNNYTNGMAFVDEIYDEKIKEASESINKINDEINANNKNIKIYEDNINELENQFNQTNDLIYAKIKNRVTTNDIKEKTNLQKEIDSLKRYRSDIEKRIEMSFISKEYESILLENSNDKLAEEQAKLETVRAEKKAFESKIISQLREKDEKLIDDLKKEHDSLSGTINDLYKMIDLFELVDKIENNKNIDSNELNNVMINLKDLYFIKNMIQKKEKQVSDLENKVKDLKNYEIDKKEYDERKKQYDSSMSEAQVQLNKINEQISSLETIKKDLDNNLKQQSVLNEEISELGKKLRSVSETNDEEFENTRIDIDFSRDKLKLLKQKEEEYKKDYSLEKLSKLKLQKQNIQNRIEVLNRSLNNISRFEDEKYNKFKLYTDQEKIAALKSEIKSLNSMIDISSRVENILKESNKLTNKSSDVLTDNKVESNNQFQILNNDSTQNLNNNDTPKYFDATKLDFNNAEDLQKLSEYLEAGYDIIIDPEDDRLKNFSGHSSNLNNADPSVNNVSGGNDRYVEPNPNHAIIPYNAIPEKDTTLHNITRVKKSSKFAEIKKKIKEKLPKIISLVLCGVATIGAVIGCSKINSNDLEQAINDNIASEIYLQDETLPVDIAIEDLVNKPFVQELSTDNVVENNVVEGNNIEHNEAEEKDNYVAEKEMEIMEVKHLQIGDAVKFTGDKIYLTSKEANKEKNGLMPYFSNENIRTISAIQYVSPDGNDYITITEKNKDKGLELSKLGYQVEAVCIKEGATTYEGWINLKDMEVTNGKVRH